MTICDHMPRKVDPRLRSRMAAPAPYTHWIGKGTPRRRKVPLELETARLWLSHPWECPCSLWHWLSRSGSSPVPPLRVCPPPPPYRKVVAMSLPHAVLVGVLKELRRIGGRGSGSPLTRAFAGSKPLLVVVPARLCAYYKAWLTGPYLRRRVTGGRCTRGMRARVPGPPHMCRLLSPFGG
jgi:hypothetical protein